MDDALNGGFNTEKQRAIERMREMNSRSKYRQSARNEQDINREKNISSERKAEVPFLSGLGIPFLSNIGTDSDISLIIGLVLILMSENADKLLLLALLYIML